MNLTEDSQPVMWICVCYNPEPWSRICIGFPVELVTVNRFYFTLFVLPRFLVFLPPGSGFRSIRIQEFSYIMWIRIHFTPAKRIWFFWSQGKNYPRSIHMRTATGFMCGKLNFTEDSTMMWTESHMSLKFNDKWLSIQPINEYSLKNLFFSLTFFYQCRD